MNRLPDITSQPDERSAAQILRARPLATRLAARAAAQRHRSPAPEPGELQGDELGSRSGPRNLQFRSLFMHAPAAMLVIDRDGAIAIANLQARAMFAFGSVDPAGTPVGELVPGLPEASRDWYRALPEVRAGACTGPVRELELMARRRGGDEFPVEVSLVPLVTDAGVFLSVALVDATERMLAAEALARQAHRDPLTGLPNRVLFLERLEQALARSLRSGRPLAVVFLDLDDFKLVNDSLGHDQGDVLLRKLTPRLIAAVRVGDTVGRLGGDEFVALCEDLSTDTDAAALAQRITDAVAAPVRLGGVVHELSVSTGVVMVRDPRKVSAQTLLRDADAAMYSAKADGKGRVAVFDETMRKRLHERVALETDLRRAVREGELRVFYQPVVELAAERVVGAEALVRWQHPRRGLLEPDEFIAAAERAGVLAAIGEWVITQACVQAAAWRELFPDPEHSGVGQRLGQPAGPSRAGGVCQAGAGRGRAGGRDAGARGDRERAARA